MASKPQELDLQAVIGFGGQVKSGLILHPDQKRLIYPLGCTIVLKQLLEHKQEFLSAHEYPISCVCINKSGTLLASGEATHMGFTSRIIVWDLTTMDIKYELQLHKGEVQSMQFSHNDKYLATLGGPDDNKLVLWELSTGQAICGSSAASDSAFVVKFYNNDSEKLVTAGKYHIRTWTVDRVNRKLRPIDCKLGQLKRVFNDVVISEDDSLIYGGTASGDVVCINANTQLFTNLGPKKKPFSNGVQKMMLNGKGQLVVAAGDGTVAVMNVSRLSVARRIKVEGKVTSLQFNEARDHFFVGTAKCNIYCACYEDLEFELRMSAHYSPISSVAFPKGYSELFVTASNDIRVWNRKTCNELLRIQIPNVTCKCACISADGKTILSGWSDGKVRGFLPQTGRLKYAINDAHLGSVNDVKISDDNSIIVSGGEDGCVRVWRNSMDSQTMMVSWKEHKSPVTHLEFSKDQTEIISSAGDGSCIVWNLVELHRTNALFSQNQFTHILYHPDQSQLLTTGCDRQITWWCAADVEKIRELEGSDTAAINSLSITSDGEMFASAGADEKVRLWKYDDGIVTHVGHGHSATINGVEISPDSQSIVSVGEEGGIFVYNFPV